MNNRRSFLKRVGAYLIDLCIVVIIAGLISSIPGINKESKRYQEIYKEYEVKYNEYSDTLKLLEETYEDKVLTEEEYNKFVDYKYAEKITEKYDDKELTEKEYKELVKEINKDFDNVAKDYVYLLNKNNKVNRIATLVLTLLYFGILQFLLKGQTIGKRLLKIKVVSATKKKINVLTYILRSLIVNDVFLNTIATVFLFTATKQVYTTANGIIETLVSICEVLIIFTVMTHPTGRGFHDLLCNTKVVSSETKKEESKLIEVKEEKKTPTKKNTAKKTTTKKTIEAKYKEKSTK